MATVCNLCGSMWHEELQRHAEKQQALECSRCGWTTSRGSALELHLNSCLAESQTQERCLLCGEWVSSDLLRFHQDQNSRCQRGTKPLEPLVVLLEAELVLMEHHAERHGCGCPRHRPWSVTS